MKFIKLIKKKIKMIKDKNTFRDTMYDYANINEYFSFYGNVIYISTDYYHGNDYFLVLKRDTKYALVTINQEEIQYYFGLKNRDNITRDLDTLYAKLEFVEGLHNFRRKLDWYLLNVFFNEKSRFELIKIKNSDLVLWNFILVENVINNNRRDKTIATKLITHESRQLNPSLHLSFVHTVNVYNTQFTVDYDWVEGNAFVDVTIYHFNYKSKRRLNLFDISELNAVLSVMSLGDDYKTLEYLEGFILNV
jgi:hypothetical protein